MEAITDIAVVFPDKGESLPDDTWKYVGNFETGYPVNCNTGDSSKPKLYLAIRRRKNSIRFDHITDVI